MMGVNTKAAHDARVDLHVSSEGYKHTLVNQTLRSSHWLLFFLNDCKDLENPWCRFNLQIFRKEMTLFWMTEQDSISELNITSADSGKVGVTV